MNNSIICEDCDELGVPCESCLNLPVKIEKIPEICKESLIFVEEVLNQVFEINILSDMNINGRKAFVRDLEIFVRKRFPSANLSLFGSSVNGFGFQSSDLDVCMTLKHKIYESAQQRILKSLCNHLRNDTYCNYENVIGLYRATIPLVKFSALSMDWKCDVSLDNILAVHNSKLLNTYASFDVRCRKLGCALKLLTKKAGIADCVSKTLSSYSYILMTIHYLQQITPPVLPVLEICKREVFEDYLFIDEKVANQNHWYYETIPELKKRYGKFCTNSSDVSELWLGLLDFYLQYDSNYAVTIIQKEPLLTSSLKRRARLFNIQDPFLQERNLGCIVSEKKAYEIMQIFRRARILFGKAKPKDITDLKNHYFSTMNLTGQYTKDMDCPLCGVYGHDKSICKKADTYRRPNKNFYYFSK